MLKTRFGREPSRKRHGSFCGVITFQIYIIFLYTHAIIYLCTKYVHNKYKNIIRLYLAIKYNISNVVHMMPTTIRNRLICLISATVQVSISYIGR